MSQRPKPGVPLGLTVEEAKPGFFVISCDAWERPLLACHSREALYGALVALKRAKWVGHTRSETGRVIRRRAINEALKVEGVTKTEYP